VPARSRHLAANDGLDVISHSRVTIAQLFEKGSGVLDIGEQEGDQAGWEVRDPRRSALDPTQLPRHEADGIDAVSHRGVEQPPASALFSAIVLERDAAEPSQRVSHVRLIMDRQTPPSRRRMRRPGPAAFPVRLL
jgi:hypothetical protein